MVPAATPGHDQRGTPTGLRKPSQGRAGRPNAVPIDGNRVWSHLGQQELHVGQRIARVFYPHVVSRRQSHANGDIDRMPRAGGDDDLL